LEIQLRSGTVGDAFSPGELPHLFQISNPQIKTSQAKGEKQMKNSIQITKAIVHVTNSHPYSPWRRGVLLIPLALAWLALSPGARAVCQDGCSDVFYENTFLGEDALLNNTTGYDNTANGGHALFSNTDGYYNTATGVDVFIATPPAPTTRRAVMRR